MSRYIDIEAFDYWHDDGYDLYASYEALHNAPSIDIVRCKDCRHSEESLVSGSVYCNEMDRAISENGFCHKGERKESE